ncbi:MAG: glycosyltransferase 87 family protein [Gordonia sp. (in: high G+C Gram-positive bacteria)]
MKTQDAQDIRALRSIPAMVVIVAGVLALGALAWHIWAVPIDQPYGLFTNGIDTRVYRGGAHAVWNGLPLYEGPVYRVWQFTYTPFAAVGFLPLAFMSEWGAWRFMNAVNIVCLVLLIALSLRALRFRCDGKFIAVVIAFSIAATTIEPVHTTIWNGQINLFLVLIVVADLTLRTGRWRGIGVGLAAGIKLTPMFFLAFLAVTRQWRAIAVALGTFAATVAIGFAVLPHESWLFWTQTIRDTSRIGPIDWPANQTFNGFFIRLGVLDLVHLPGWLWLPVGVVVGLLGLWAAYRAHQAGATLLAVTVTGMTGTAVAPFSWCHHWVWFVPLAIIAIVHAVDQFDRARPLTWLWWLAPIGLLLATFTWHRFTADQMRFGIFKLLWIQPDFDLSGWHGIAAVLLSGAYPFVLLATIVVTLCWTRTRDPIRFNATAVSA